VIAHPHDGADGQGQVTAAFHFVWNTFIDGKKPPKQTPLDSLINLRGGKPNTKLVRRAAAERPLFKQSHASGRFNKSIGQLDVVTHGLSRGK